MKVITQVSRTMWNEECASTTMDKIVPIVYSAQFREVLDAIAWEKKVKRWNRRKKEALIRREYDRLPELAKRKTPYKKQTILCHGEEPQSGVSNHGTK